MLGSDDFAKPPEVSTFVRIDSFNDSSIDIMLYCFTVTTIAMKNMFGAELKTDSIELISPSRSD